VLGKSSRRSFRERWLRESRSGSSKTRRARLESGGGSGVGVGGVGSYQTPLALVRQRSGGWFDENPSSFGKRRGW
jgi:hypothetical protein